MKKAFLFLVGMALPAQAFASQIIRCEKPGIEPVTITIDAFKKFGASLNCIEGDFIADMTPCAPNGGYGLSAPTGTASLVDVVWRWQDYGDHFGGIADTHINDTTMYFNGGFYSGNQKWSSQWSFKIDRLTGIGRLTLKRSAPLKDISRNYACKAMARKF